MKTLIKKMGIILFIFPIILLSQIKKEWYFNAGYSEAAQTIIDYSDGHLSKEILSFFRFTDFRQNIHFFYIGAEQHLKISDSAKSDWVWGIYFSKKGFHFHTDFISDGNEYVTSEKYTFYYLNFPLYIQRKLFKNILINYGITPSLMFYNRYDFKHDVYIVSSNPFIKDEKHIKYTDYFGEEEVNFIDISLRLGLSYPLNNRILIDFNYDKGLVNINRNKISGSIGYQNIWLLGIRYKLK